MTNLQNSSLDLIGSTATLDRITGSMLYNRLFRVLPGVNQPSSGEKVGDAVETYELSPDKMKLTLKIRSNLGTDPRPPLNGRNLTAEDVMFSWNKWSTVSPLRSDLVNSLNPDGPVAKVSSPDASTVVFDLAFPSVILLDYLTDGFYFWVMPKESDGGFDPKAEAHGGGPYYVTDFLQGAKLTMARNDNFYEKPIPYYDKLNYFIVPEVAAQLAQFEAGQLDVAPGTAITNDKVVDVYKRHTQTQLYKLPILNVAATSRFGYAPGEPFLDIRVRQAISMSYDRASLAEYFTNKSKLAAQGLDVDAKWASHLSAMWPMTGDPSNPKTFGPNAQYFAHNPDEAKKLLDAAGQTNLEFTYHIDNFSQSNISDAELLAGQLRDAGLVKVDQKVEEYVAWFLPNIYRGKGNFKGMAHGALGYKFSPEVFAYSYYHTSPGTALYPAATFDDLVSRVTAITREFDDSKRMQLLKDFESEAAKQMPSLPLGSGGGATSFGMAWPWVTQAAVLNEWPGDGVASRSTLITRYWFDQSKKS